MNEAQKDDGSFINDEIERLFKTPVSEMDIATAILHLQHETRRKPENNTNIAYCSSKRGKILSDGEGLKPRHANYLANQLRKALLLHDWNSVLRFLLKIIHLGPRKHSSLITKACTVLVTNHPDLSLMDIRKIVGEIADYDEDDDVEKLISIICSVRQAQAGEVLPSVFRAGRKLCKTERKIYGKLVDNKIFTQCHFNSELPKTKDS